MRAVNCLLVIVLVLSPAAFPAGVVNILDFGAKGDKTSLNTAAIQKAIDRSAQRGGGTVVFPAGDYLTGTLVLKTGVILQLDSGCTIWGSTDLADYPEHVPAFRSYTDEYTTRSLIYAESVERGGIVGQGTINGNGRAFKGPYKLRPYLLRFITCRFLTIEGITLRDSPMWVHHYLACRDVRVARVTVDSPDANYNNDGIDIDSCERFSMEGCHIFSQDDAICLKSTSDLPCRDVVITNCVLRSHCNGFKLGTESVGGFQNVAISNSTVSDTRLAGVAIETVDGGDLERIAVTNLTMHNVGTPIFLRRGARLRPYEGQKTRPEHPGVLRDVVISNITASQCGDNSSPISGLPGYDVENVMLQNLIFSFDGGGRVHSLEVPEEPGKYPDFDMFGELPAYGFYIRHARGIRLAGVMLRHAGREMRPPIILDDVKDFDLSGLTAQARADGAIMHARNLRGALMHECRLAEPVGAFLQLEGAESGGIVMTGNVLDAAAQAVERAADVPRSAVDLR